MAKLDYFIWSNLSAFGGTGVFITCQALIVLGYIVFATCVFKFNARPVKTALEFGVFSVGIFLMELSALCLIEARIEYVLFSLGSAFVLSVTLLIRVKKREITIEQKNLVRFIDGQIKRAKKEDEDLFVNDEKSQNLQAEKTVEEKVKPLEKDCGFSKSELDFNHVKNVIERLEYYPLTQSDKRQVLELESTIKTAEKGEMDAQTKSRINDGLSSLLKIMAKYGA